ncbi:MAG: energy-coupled thiamine transporter ThiT [Clostridia bacterium]|nr:energy-coupled thiamine transporter ThiT [Clostridia bacterium]
MSNQKSSISPVQRLAECGIMLALAVVLNEFTPIKLPYGGSVTFFAQLPIVIIGYRHGVKWGLFTGLAMGIIEMLFGLANFSYVTGIAAYLILIFADYIVAFSALGLGGIFRNKIHNQALSLAAGGALVSIIRFICHFISGATIWGGYAEDTPVLIYSLTYNGSYMLPELIITVVGALIVGSLLDLRAPRLRSLKKAKTASATEE